MKLLFDQNLSPRLVHLLIDLYPASSHVSFNALDQANDRDVWEFARDGGYLVVSKDTDFNDLVLLRGFPPKVIWLRIGNCSTNRIVDLLRQFHPEIAQFEADTEAGVLTLQ